MRQGRVVHWIRFSAGFGLLLLLVAAQEKLCPWLTIPVQPTEPPIGAGDGGATPRPRKAPLPQIVPDVTAQRYAVPGAAAERRLETGNRDGFVCCGPQHSDSAGGAFPASPFIAPWRAERPRALDLACPAAPPLVRRPTPLLTAINPHGPPAAPVRRATHRTA